MDPSNETCIYSTLKFVSEQAKRYNATPIVTFDQPLWWKALTIVLNEPQTSDIKRTVLRLGGFHTQMSFLGCIGHLMAESGLQEILELVYAKNAVVHMMSGKAIARAIRGHCLVDAALKALLVRDTFNVPLSVASTGDDDQPLDEPLEDQGDAESLSSDLQLVGLMCKQLLNKEVKPEEV
jgi:hypothetical protein